MTKLGIISDIHGNYPALEKVLQFLHGEKCDSIICLGDTCGYYPMINECINRLRSEGIQSILGNHDEYLIGKSTCPRSRSANECITYQQGVITRDNLQWVEELPTSFDESGLFAVHGGLNNPIDEYFASFDFILAEELHPGVQLFCTGHTHTPSVQTHGNAIYCNPGSVGQPRDWDPRASCAIIEKGLATIYRVEYPIEETARAMADAGFSDYYYRNLFEGCKIGDTKQEKEGIHV